MRERKFVVEKRRNGKGNTTSSVRNGRQGNDTGTSGDSKVKAKSTY